MNASEIARALGPNAFRSGHWWRCRCPAHGSRGPTLALRDGPRGLAICCHAGCDRVDVRGELERLGLLDSTYAPHLISDAPTEDADNRAFAKRIWDAARPAERSPELACYLRARAITMPIPPALRFARASFHRPTGCTYPAMIARLSGPDGVLQAIQRTYLTPECTRKATVDAAKMSLGSTLGTAIHLAPAGPVLMIGEGVETVLSVIQRTGLPGWAITGHVNYRSLVLPAVVEEVIFLGDNDGNQKARTAVLRSIGLARQRYLDEGRRVRITFPRRRGVDFNDMLMEASRAVAA